MTQSIDIRWTAERYTFAEAADIVGARTQTIANWFRGYDRHGRDFLPVIASSVGRATDRRRIGFLELVEAKVVAACRSQGISLRRVRNARIFASARLGVEYPFASKGFSTDGRSILYEFETTQVEQPEGPFFVDVGNRAGQTALPGYIGEVVELLEFAGPSADWPTRFFPRGSDNLIVIDPRLRSGQPIVVQRGITVDAIWRRLQGGDVPAYIADDYGIGLEAVLAVRDYKMAA
ncbi:MAG: DUF433 domain-containing protein [Chloroflexi bacterium]|nr:DUF433 domain-containing protein [Chloroflexota bacterium]